jgi:hypothetical protein
MKELISLRLTTEQLNKLKAEAVRLEISKGELLRLLINTITL